MEISRRLLKEDGHNWKEANQYCPNFVCAQFFFFSVSIFHLLALKSKCWVTDNWMRRRVDEFGTPTKSTYVNVLSYVILSSKFSPHVTQRILVQGIEHPWEAWTGLKSKWTARGHRKGNSSQWFIVLECWILSVQSCCNFPLVACTFARNLHQIYTRFTVFNTKYLLIVVDYLIHILKW